MPDDSEMPDADFVMHAVLCVFFHNVDLHFISREALRRKQVEIINDFLSK